MIPNLHPAPSRLFLRPTLLLGGLLAAILLTGSAAPAAAAESPAAGGQERAEKMIVLGFDGADAKLTRQWMDEGKLPNLARLRDQGTFAPLDSTIPSQTPVSWSTFSTGLSPGRHAIFDFLKRDPKTYRPGFAAFDQGTAPFLWGERNGLFIGLIVGLALLLVVFLIAKLFKARTAVAAAVALVLAIGAGIAAGAAAQRLLPVDHPIAINHQQGETVWERLGSAGHRVKVMRIPVTFPPEPFDNGALMAGLGVPDLSGSIGKPYYFTSELFFTPKAGNEFALHLVELIDNQGEIPTEVAGPPNLLFDDEDGNRGDRVTIPMTLTVAEDRSRLTIEVSGNRLELAPGDWSDWQSFDFPFNQVVSLPGMGRFHLISLEPEVRLYLSPIQFDPENLPPIVDISTPASLAGDLAEEHGRYKTMGWAIDTWSISEGTIDEEVFMADVDFTVSKFEEMLKAAVVRDDWDVLIHYFEFTDRVQHVMWRYFDTEHPMYDAEQAARFGGTILESYQRMDKIVGEVMDTMPEGTALFVVSDHGFASFRWGMNYNTWLVENGYMTLNGQDAEGKNLDDLFGQGDFFTNVDWSQTKAYSLGLGQMYINLAGREGEGIVQPGEEYDQLVAELKAGLEAFVDPATGLNPVAHVFTRDEAYGSYDPELIPDMIVSNSDGYRVGWQDSLGAISGQTIEVNDRVWSGDHCSVYPPLVAGILFSNRPLDTAGGAEMADVMPTLLETFGVEVPEGLDGRSLAR